jgi:hypothetical protein
MLTDVGFGTIEIRGRRPYRILDTENYATDELILSKVSKCALSKTQCQRICVFTGKAAIYYGKDAYFDDKKDTLLKIN